MLSGAVPGLPASACPGPFCPLTQSCPTFRLSERAAFAHCACASAAPARKPRARKPRRPEAPAPGRPRARKPPMPGSPPSPRLVSGAAPRPSWGSTLLCIPTCLVIHSTSAWLTFVQRLCRRPAVAGSTCSNAAGLSFSSPRAHCLSVPGRTALQACRKATTPGLPVSSLLSRILFPRFLVFLLPCFFLCFPGTRF